MLNKLLFILISFPLFITAQILDPVKWKSETKDLGNNEFQVEIQANLDDGWHIYSISHPDGGIGIPVSATFEKAENIQLIGKVKEIGSLIDSYNELFEQQERKYKKTVKFVQKVKVTGDKPVNLKAEIEYQVCDHEKCLPPDYKEFTFNLKPTVKEVAAEIPPVETTTEEPQTTEDTISETVTISEPATDSLNQSPASTGPSNEEFLSEEEIASNNQGLWKIFIIGFLGGIAALLMPCIFPLIPLTVSLFTKQSKTRGEGISKAMIFGLSIILIYVLLGLLVTIIFGVSALNEMASSPWMNLAFFVIFIVFAISFFGAFELTLPSSWINFADKGADKGGFIGIFFMAFTLALVSFSCTGPIIGSLLVGAVKQSNYFALIVGMFGFSFALAVPFTIFALFPGWLATLPKSGGWLNTVKVTLGFLELALALKFLSNADLVWQAGWLKREVFLALWIGILVCMALYLLGRIKLPHDSTDTKIGTGRLFFAIITLSFVFYLIPGMWGAPLHLVSGITPPMHYAESPQGIGGSSVVGTATGESGSKIIPGMELGPQNIPAFKDFELAAAYSRKVNKPIMLDFTGYSCANCRKVEDKVWSNPKVKNALMNDVILVSLYVDERKELPLEEQKYSEALEKNITTIGQKWTAFEIEHFKANSQPLYSIVDADLKRYNEPIGAIYDIDTYLKWIQKGVDNYNKK